MIRASCPRGVSAQWSIAPPIARSRSSPKRFAMLQSVTSFLPHQSQDFALITSPSPSLVPNQNSRIFSGSANFILGDSLEHTPTPLDGSSAQAATAAFLGRGKKEN